MEAVEPLDLIVFRGSDIVSWFIRKLERLELKDDCISHVGVAVNREVIPHLTAMDPSRMYVLESTVPFSEPKDVISGGWRFGVQIRELNDVVTNYSVVKKGKVGYAKLKQRPVIDSCLVDKMKVIITKYANCWYPINPIRLLAIVSPTFRYLRDALDTLYIESHRLLTLTHVLNPSDIDNLSIEEALRIVQQCSIFCSELAVIVYQELGIIDKTIVPSDVAPVSIVHMDVFEEACYPDNPSFVFPLDDKGRCPYLDACSRLEEIEVKHKGPSLSTAS
jgi:hypothetical protein